MPTPAEHRALLFVAALAALGVGARGFAALRRPDPPVSDRAALARQISEVDSLLASGGRKRVPSSSARPGAAPGGPNPGRPPARSVPPAGPGPATGPARLIDMDVATAAELDLLPGIGPALAARIVADREANGPFGSAEGLQRVRGVGPALAARVQPHVTFSLPPRLNRTEVPAPGGVRRP